MNTSTQSLPAKFPPDLLIRPSIWSFPQRLAAAGKTAFRFIAEGIVAPILTTVRGVVRGFGLIVLTALAIADALLTRLMVTLTHTGLAHARARWLHRWSRAVRLVLGLRTTTRGHAPVSGIIVANHTSLLDAVVLAAIHPCVFVAGADLRRRPLLGLLARFGGTIFVQSARGVDLQLATFAIQRAVLRRQIVVIFPECNPQRGFTTALFQPASELGCSVTATAIGYEADQKSGQPTPLLQRESGLLAHLKQIATLQRSRVTVAFDGPRFHRGDRKDLARQLRGELLALDTAAAH